MGIKWHVSRGIAMVNILKWHAKYFKRGNISGGSTAFKKLNTNFIYQQAI